MPLSILKSGRMLCTFAILCAGLSACAGPPIMKAISFALDGISYIATDKTVADHGLSAVAQKDCKMMRTLKGEDVCQHSNSVVEEALIDPEKQNEQGVR